MLYRISYNEICTHSLVKTSGYIDFILISLWDWMIIIQQYFWLYLAFLSSYSVLDSVVVGFGYTSNVLWFFTEIVFFKFSDLKVKLKWLYESSTLYFEKFSFLVVTHWFLILCTGYRHRELGFFLTYMKYGFLSWTPEMIFNFDTQYPLNC